MGLPAGPARPPEALYDVDRPGLPGLIGLILAQLCLPDLFHSMRDQQKSTYIIPQGWNLEST